VPTGPCVRAAQRRPAPGFARGAARDARRRRQAARAEAATRSPDAGACSHRGHSSTRVARCGSTPCCASRFLDLCISAPACRCRASARDRPASSTCAASCHAPGGQGAAVRRCGGAGMAPSPLRAAAPPGAATRSSATTPPPPCAAARCSGVLPTPPPSRSAAAGRCAASSEDTVSSGAPQTSATCKGRLPPESRSRARAGSQPTSSATTVHAPAMIASRSDEVDIAKRTPCETRISAQRRAKGVRREAGGAGGCKRVVGGREACRRRGARGAGGRRSAQWVRAPNAARYRIQRAGTAQCAARPRAAGDAAPCGRGARRRSDAGGWRSRERPGWKPADARAAAEAARWRGAARGANGHAPAARPRELRDHVFNLCVLRVRALSELAAPRASSARQSAPRVQPRQRSVRAAGLQLASAACASWRRTSWCFWFTAAGSPSAKHGNQVHDGNDCELTIKCACA